jgi:uncharacterized membrane protein
MGKAWAAQSSESGFFRRSVVLATAWGLIARRESLLPRKFEDQTLISTGAALMGAATGIAAEAACVATARQLPLPATRARLGATAVLSVGCGAGLAWARRGTQRSALDDAVGTTAQLFLAALVGGEAMIALDRRLPSPLRSDLVQALAATGLAAGVALRGLRKKMAEPRDLIKAGVEYDFLDTVSGGEASLLPRERLDREGRKFLGCALPAPVIARVMGGEALDPIRVYAGLGSASSALRRVRSAVAELERLGGFDRSRIVIFCPTGAGLVNPVAVETEELMSRGDVASIVVQYANKRAVRARRYLPRGRETWWLLLAEIYRALLSRSPEQRPELLVYGESLGAEVVAEVLSEGGTETLESSSIARGALMGLPFHGGQRLRALRARGERLPEGLAVCSDLGELQSMPRDKRTLIRYLIFTHAEDPVANYTGIQLAYRRPWWLRAENRHPRLPRRMRWLPGITWLQVLFDIKNGTSFQPTFEARAHDYRLELPALLRVAYGHTDLDRGTVEAIEQELAERAWRQTQRESGRRTPV